MGAAEDESISALLVDTAIERFGRIDLLVNAVGGAPFVGSALTLTRQDLMATMALNTWPTLSLIREAMARGLADENGAIVNISSGSPKKTTPSMAAYAAAKAALNALTRTLANELGRLGVRVNAVSPGLTKTHATRDIWEADEGQAAGRNLLLGRLTEAEDIAAAVAFLLSEEARSITGVLLDVDAGNHVDTGSWSPFSPEAVGQPGGAPASAGSRTT
jgi:NAD(P)-dependent dehydrogenase (short-subunit alcohol dehydrogenase family)